MSPEERDALLQRLLDESDIRALLARYARAIDRMDWDLLRDCYHPDAIDDHGVYDGPIDGFVDWLAEMLPRDVSTTHFLGNELIEVEGDVAFAETYALGIHRMPAADGAPARDRVMNVRYCDRLERRDGRWRIAHRAVIYESSRIDPVLEEPDLTGRLVDVRAFNARGFRAPGPPVTLRE